MTPEQQRAIAIAKARAAAESAPPEKPVYSGGILPFSKDAEGNVSFDSNAGLLGTIKRAFTLPGEVYEGKVDPLSDEGIGRAFEMGATLSPANPAVRSGELAVPGVKNALRPPDLTPPTAEALKAAGAAGYDAARDMGVHYSSDAVARVAEAARRSMEADGILDELAPKTFSILDKLGNPPAGSTAPLAGLEAARRGLGNAGKDFTNPTEQLAAHRVSEAIDEFIQGGDPASVVAGPAAAAARTIEDARGNYAAGMRSDKLTGVEEAADLRAGAANSGLNLDNSVRGRIASLLLNPKAAAGFSAEERGLLEEVAKGTPTRNAIRYVGNLLGGGGGLGTAVVGGGAGLYSGSAAIAAALSVGLPVAGFAAKRGANALTRRALGAADEAGRSRSPLYRQMQEAVPKEIPDAARREAIAAVVRALMLPQPDQRSHQ